MCATKFYQEARPFESAPRLSYPKQGATAVSTAWALQACNRADVPDALTTTHRMIRNARPLTVYYDAVCPACVRDRAWYEKLSAKTDDTVEWFDINGRDAELRAAGIDPAAALRELHVRDADGSIHRELDAYILLMSRVPTLRPLAWLIGLPGIRTVLSRLYRSWVLRRLRAENRL